MNTDPFLSKEGRASVAIVVDGQLYAVGARSSPGTWSGEDGADTILLESEDYGETLEAVSYPCAPTEVILAWAEADGRVLAGTNDGRLISRNEDGMWTEAGTVPTRIRPITVS